MTNEFNYELNLNLDKLFDGLNFKPLEHLQHTLDEVDGLLISFPEEIEKIAKQVSDATTEFSALNESLNFDPKTFESVFWAINTAFSNLWDTISEKIDLSQKIYFEFDSPNIDLRPTIQAIASFQNTVSANFDELYKSLNELSKVISKIEIPKDKFGITDLISTISDLVGILSDLGILDFLKNIFKKKEIEELSDVLKNLNTDLDNVSSAFEKVHDDTEQLRKELQFINDLLKQIKESLKDIFDIYEESSEYMLENLPVFTEAINESISALVNNLVETIDNALSDIVDIIFNTANDILNRTIEFVGNIILHIREFINDVIEALKECWENIKEVFAPAIEFFAHIFSKAWEGIKNAFSTVGEFFSGIWNTIKEIFTTIGHSIADGISGAFKATVNAVINFAESIINGFIGSINTVIGVINKIPHVKLNFIPTLNIPRLEFGGLVTPGQIFVAREAGPELVGSFGGYTAVMNNNQIVESVSNAVYKAQREQNALLREQNALLQQLLNSTSDVTMKVGETQFAKVTVKAINNLARRQGRVYLNI